ncbi:MAG: hypothetical protein ACI9P5_004252 [Saprospiraceae bacterium]
MLKDSLSRIFFQKTCIKEAYSERFAHPYIFSEDLYQRSVF